LRRSRPVILCGLLAARASFSPIKASSSPTKAGSSPTKAGSPPTKASSSPSKAGSFPTRASRPRTKASRQHGRVVSSIEWAGLSGARASAPFSKARLSVLEAGRPTTHRPPTTTRPATRIAAPERPFGDALDCARRGAGPWRYQGDGQ